MFPGVPGVDGLAFGGGGGFGAAVGTEHLPVQHDMGPALVGDLLEGVVQVRGLRREYVDDLVAVAVGGRSGYAEPSAHQGDVALVAEPGQDQQCLLPAGQRPGSGAGAAGAALSAQQPGHLTHEFTGDVEQGTIGDHVGSSSRVGRVEENSLVRTPRLRQHRPNCRLYACRGSYRTTSC